MHLQIGPRSNKDLSYDDVDINRDIAIISRHFNCFKDTPLSTTRACVRKRGHVRILDAGCGTGRGLFTLKDYVSRVERVDENVMQAVGVSLTDFSKKFTGSSRDRERLRNGYIDLRIGNLATIQLEPSHYDVAYAYQVLIHNKEISPAISNILSALRRGGIFYFDSLVEQEKERLALAKELGSSKWDIQSKTITQTFYNGTDTRVMNRIRRR